jgi:hypothetical protein
LIRCFDNFNEKYLGSLASAPAGPQQEGALYWNSTSNEIFVWNGTAWQTIIPTQFTQNSNYQVTGTTTARNLVTRGADIINVRDFGATGNGTTDDTAAIQAAITAAPAGAAIYFPRGSYKAARIQITKSLTIFGDGIGVTEWVYGLQYGIQIAVGADAYFVVSGENTKFYLRNGTIVDKFGLRATGQGLTIPSGQYPIITNAIGCLDATSINSSTFANLIDVKNVKFLNFWTSIELSCKTLDVQNCEFKLTYGKAGIGQPDTTLNGTINGHPCCGIQGAFGSEIVKNNEYDGLVDYSFSGANSGYLPYRVGGDGLVYSQCRDWAIIAWNTYFDGKHECSNNVIKNHFIEGIQYNNSSLTSSIINFSLVISNNFISPTQKNFIDGSTYKPCIAVFYSNSGSPNTKIVSNYIENTALGINVAGQSSASKVPYGNIEISNNVLNGVITGISCTFFSEKDVVSNNTIFCQSKSIKDATATIRSQGIGLSGATTSYSLLQGLYIVNCNPLVTNNTLSAEYDFDVTTTLSSQSSNVLTLGSATGIESSGWGILIKYNGKSRFLPVTNVSGNDVTVDSAYLSGTTFPNGIAVYASKGFAPFFGAINIVNQSSQAPNLNQVFYNTTIKGFLKDNSSTDVSGTGNSSTMVNTTAIDVYEKVSSSYPQPQFFREDGCYYKN